MLSGVARLRLAAARKAAIVSLCEERLGKIGSLAERRIRIDEVSAGAHGKHVSVRTERGVIRVGLVDRKQ